MTKFLSLFSILIPTLSAQSCIPPNIDQGLPWVYGSTAWFSRVPIQIQFKDAEFYCNNLGDGISLAKIYNYIDNNAVASVLNGIDRGWIAGFSNNTFTDSDDDSNEKIWYWLDYSKEDVFGDEVIEYFEWDEKNGQPVISDENNCIGYYGPVDVSGSYKKWFAGDCSKYNFAVCEYRC